MTQHLVRSLEALKQQVLALGNLVEIAVANAVKSVLNYDGNLASAVVEKDNEIDEMEVTIEEECLKLLALHQPVASDLRFIVAVLKMNNDLERIADLAVNIAWKAHDLTKFSRMEMVFDIASMAQQVQSMLGKSLHALVAQDVELAQEVLTLDDNIDLSNRENHEKIGVRLSQNISQIKPLLLLLSTSKNLERIADHATNIAEDVIYTVAGRIVRHGGGVTTRDM